MKTANFRLPAALLLGLTLILGPRPSPAQASSHARGYSFGLAKGTLLPNFSFEAEFEGYQTTTDANFTSSARHKGEAFRGSYVGYVSGQNLKNDPNPENNYFNTLSTDYIRIQGGQSYTLSFYVKTSGVDKGSWPVIWFFCDEKEPVPTSCAPTGSRRGTSYETVAQQISGNASKDLSIYTLYTLNFTTPTQAVQLRVNLFETNITGATGTFRFDDVLLEEGYLTAADVRENRKLIAEEVAFSDHLGRVHQSQVKMGNSDPGYYQVTHTDFGATTDPEASYLPYASNSTNAAFEASAPAYSNSYYSGTPSYQPSAGGYPASKALLSNEPSPRIKETAAPGYDYRLGGGHTVKNSFFYTFDSAIPLDLENPPGNFDFVGPRFRMDWVKDPEGQYSVSVTNGLGQTVKAGQKVGEGSNSRYVESRYNYYPSGLLRQVETPLDESLSDKPFSQVSTYNARGEKISHYQKDRGLSKFWYNAGGLIRFSQNEEQRAKNLFSYTDYDALGRVVSIGEDSILSFSQSLADLDNYTGLRKREHVGYLYDDIASFDAKVGIPLAEIMTFSGSPNGMVQPWNGYGRLVCRYNRNPEVGFSKFTPKERLVAEFFRYDELGQVACVSKYFGAVKSEKRKRQEVWYSYDALGRASTRYIMQFAGSPSFSSYQRFSYDRLGRVVKVIDLYGKRIVEFDYAPHGPVRTVSLGEQVNSTRELISLSYTFHLHGGQKSLKAKNRETGEVLFEEFLGYDEKAHSHPNSPGTMQKRYDGKIAQSVS